MLYTAVLRELSQNFIRKTYLTTALVNVKNKLNYYFSQNQVLEYFRQNTDDS